MLMHNSQKDLIFLYTHFAGNLYNYSSIRLQDWYSVILDSTLGQNMLKNVCLRSLMNDSKSFTKL